MTVSIRRAESKDAEAVAALAARLHDHLRSLGEQFPNFDFSAAAYRRDGFGTRPAFEGLVAEVDGVVVGYLLHHDGYDTDANRRLLCVIDLYVAEEHRSLGLARALVDAAVRVAREHGATDLRWVVNRHNVKARAFYERLGAQTSEHLLLQHLPVTPRT
jgi:ribosomal protein S18 acetylase RimI-like enzyme